MSPMITSNWFLKRVHPSAEKENTQADIGELEKTVLATVPIITSQTGKSQGSQGIS